MLAPDTTRGGLSINNQRLVTEAENKAVDEHWQGWKEIIRPLTDGLFSRLGNRVLTGPFHGMNVSVFKTPVWDDSNAPTILLGSYEFELHPVIRKAVARKPDTIINAGCAEGYYAVGLARLLPQAIVYAMDSESKALDACERHAWLNDIPRSQLKTVIGYLSPQDLLRGTGKKLYIVDIEGYETSVLDPELCPDLLAADIIVECHDFFIADGRETISSHLTQVFMDTHDVEFIGISAPNPNDYPFLKKLPIGLHVMAITERRPPQTAWLACWSK